MEQRDLLKDQIEQLGRVLGQLIANFLGLKSNGNIDFAIEKTNEQLKSELDIDIELLLGFNSKELEEYVKSKKLIDQYLDDLAGYFFEIGKSKNLSTEKGSRIQWLEKAQELLSLAEKNSTTLTFKRINLKKDIGAELGNRHSD